MAAEYVEINRANWASRVPIHARGYSLEKFRADPAWLSEAVRLDPRPDELLVLEYPYFETERGTEFIETKTYVEHEEDLGSPRSISFNHGIGEILTAILGAGLRLVAFEEHRSVPWDPFGAAGICDDRGEYRLRERPDRIPATYTLQAIKH